MITQKFKGIFIDILARSYVKDIYEALRNLGEEVTEGEHEKRLLWILKEFSANRLISDVRAVPYKYLESNFQDDEIRRDLETLIAPSKCQMLQAKFNDCRWIHLRDATAARNAYTLYGQAIHSGKETDSMRECFYRQISLAKALKDQTLDESLKENAYLLLSHYETVDNFCHFHILEACKEYKIFTPQEVLECCRIKTKMDLKYNLQDAYLEVMEVCVARVQGISLQEKYFRNADLLAIRRERVNLILKEANQCEQPHISIPMYKRAISLLKKVPASEKERTDIRHMLDEAQIAFSASMPVSSVNLDISKSTELMRHCMETLTDTELVLYFLNVIPLKEPEHIRKETIQRNQAFLGKQLFPVVQLDKNGKTKTLLPTLDEKDEKTVVANMEYELRQECMLGAKIYLADIFQELLHRGYCPQQEMERIINESIFVPATRRNAFIKGIMAGFHRDFVTALSILAPQVEHAIRSLAENCGDIVYSMNAQGKEAVRTRDDVLKGPCLQDCVDGTLLFYTKAVFASEYGLNIRNEIAHGLWDDQDFHSTSAFYAWWFTMRLCYEFYMGYEEAYNEMARKVIEVTSRLDAEEIVGE